MKEHTMMDALTLLGYLIAAILIVLIFVTRNMLLLIAIVAEIFVLRSIGYLLDRRKEKK